MAESSMRKVDSFASSRALIASVMSALMRSLNVVTLLFCPSCTRLDEPLPKTGLYTVTAHE
jgi:hypothetical protein